MSQGEPKTTADSGAIPAPANALRPVALVLANSGTDERTFDQLRPTPPSASVALPLRPPCPVDAEDPAWRIFVALIGARRRLAPDETLRGNVVRAVLKGLADGLDWAYTRVGRRLGQPPLVSVDDSVPSTVADGRPHMAPVALTALGGDRVDEMTAESLPSAPRISEPRGTVNGPSPGAVGRRLVVLWGWAIDQASASGPGIHGVCVYLDGVFKGTATYGLPRHDVQESFGNLFLRSGWRFALDLQGVTAGPHTLQVNALSALSGQETTYSHSIKVEPLPPPPSWRKFVLFISGCPGDTMRYRCDHAAEQVRLMGGTADVAVQGEVDLGAVLEQYQVFVLHRVLFGEDVEWFLEQARRRRLTVIYDVDDLVFDVEAAPLMAALDRMTERERDQFMDCVARSRAALVQTDAVLVSSEPLRAHVDGVMGQKCARVAPNVVSEEMLRHASRALNGTTTRGDTERSTTVRIAYLSGTPTHDRDFLTAADGLIWALDHFPSARLVTVGPVALDERFRRFGDRVEQWPLRPWQRLAEVYASVDISIAPLEPDNQFTESKSCIKYLEASLVGVPTVASARSDFRRVITHGVNGLLAESEGEWRDALASLIESSELRQQVGQAAREDVLSRHTTASAAGSFCTSIAELILQASLDQPLVINWVVRGSNDMEPGGPSAAVSHLARCLSRRGHRVRLCVVPRPGRRDRPTADTGGGLNGTTDIATFTDPEAFPPADINIATDWSTAHLVATRGASAFRAYFVQNHPGGAPVRPVEQSYFLPLRYICYGQDVAQHVADLTGRPTAHVTSNLDWEQAGTELERILLDMTFRTQVRGAPGKEKRVTEVRADVEPSTASPR